MFYFFGTVQFLFHFKNSLAQIESGTVQDAECFFNSRRTSSGTPARERPTLLRPMQRAG